MIIEDVPDFQDFTVGIKVLQTKMPIQIFGKILKAQNTYQVLILHNPYLESLTQVLYDVTIYYFLVVSVNG